MSSTLSTMSRLLALLLLVLNLHNTTNVTAHIATTHALAAESKGGPGSGGRSSMSTRCAGKWGIEVNGAGVESTSDDDAVVALIQ